MIIRTCYIMSCYETVEWRGEETSWDLHLISEHIRGRRWRWIGHVPRRIRALFWPGHQRERGDMEENWRGRKTENGFFHLDRSYHRCEKKSNMEWTSQWPYSPKGELVIKPSKLINHVIYLSSPYPSNQKDISKHSPACWLFRHFGISKDTL